MAMDWRSIRARLREFNGHPDQILGYLNDLRQDVHEGITQQKVSNRLDDGVADVKEFYPELELKITLAIWQVSKEVEKEALALEGVVKQEPLEIVIRRATAKDKPKTSEDPRNSDSPEVN